MKQRLLETSCNPVEVDRRFGGTYRLYLQGGRVSQARNEQKKSCYLRCASF
jgi:hypothetical protein